MRKIVQSLIGVFILLLTVSSCSKDNEVVLKPALYEINFDNKNFRDVEEDTTKDQSFTITNSGEEALELKSFTLSGTDKDSFTHTGIATTVSGNDGNTSFKVSFSPASVGTKTAILTIISNIGTHTVSLTGNAVLTPVGVLAITSGNGSFADVEVNSTLDKNFTLKNTGNADLVISAITLESGNATEFTTNGTTKTLTPNETYTFKVTFAPTSVGTKATDLKIASPQGDSEINLTGKATPQMFTITVVSGTNGTVNVDKTTVTSGEQIIATANATVGYEFDSWTNDVAASTGNPLTITVTSNLTIGATFKVVAPIVNIPDVNFKAALVANSNINTNGDSEIQESEAVDYEGFVNVSGGGISSLIGIEAFVNITGLYCENNQITTLDISKNTSITKLNCRNNKLTTIDITKSIALKFLDLGGNQLVNLDVTKNTLLTQLWVFNNNIQNIDVSKNTNLLSFSVGNNELATIDVTQNINLTLLALDNNNLSTIDISKNIKLLELACRYNKLTAIDVSKNIDLSSLYCGNNDLTVLNIVKNVKLHTLFAKNTKLTKLNTVNANNTTLITTLYVNQNPNLTCIQIPVNHVVNTGAWFKDTTASYSTTSCL